MSDLKPNLSLRDRRILEAQRRGAARLTAEPDLAMATIEAVAEVGEGLACTFRQGKFEARMDLGTGAGGDATAPSPGFFGRAGIGGCVAMMIKIVAVREGVTFRNVRVSISQDFYDGQIFGLDAHTAAPLETRLTIDVESDADSVVVTRIVDTALAADPWFLALRDAQHVKAEIRAEPAREVA